MVIVAPIDGWTMILQQGDHTDVAAIKANGRAVLPVMALVMSDVKSETRVGGLG